MKCPKCRKNNSSNATYCESCGTDLSTSQSDKRPVVTTGDIVSTGQGGVHNIAININIGGAILIAIILVLAVLLFLRPTSVFTSVTLSIQTAIPMSAVIVTSTVTSPITLPPTFISLLPTRTATNTLTPTPTSTQTQLTTFTPTLAPTNIPSPRPVAPTSTRIPATVVPTTLPTTTPTLEFAEPPITAVPSPKGEFLQELGPNEIIAGHGDEFEIYPEIYSSCVVFIMKGPGKFAYKVKDGIWYKWINQTTVAQYQARLNEQKNIMTGKYNCSPVKEVKK